MISNLDPSADRFLKNLSAISDRMDRAQQQLSSGKRIKVVSDEPDQISNLLQRRAELAHVDQIQKNLNETKTGVDASEQGLETATQLMDRIQSLAAQGINGTQTAETRSSIATEVEGLLSQLVGLSQTSVNGRYVFSGDSDHTVPYTLDLTQTNPVSAYEGSASTLQASFPGGTTFHVSLTAQDIFDNADPAKNVFQAVNSLRLGLKANDQSAIEQAMQNLGSASTHLSTQLAFYGNVQNQVASASDDASTRQTQLKTELSSIEDADLTQAIVDLNQGQIQQQAALQSFAKIPRTSLFDFLG